MTIHLPEPHIAQQKILDSKSRFRVVMCGRRFGKSELAQIITITRALKGQRVAYITPTYNLAKSFFDGLIKVVPFENNKSDLIIKFPNDGSIRFFTGERLDNLRGQKFHFVVVDESSFIRDLETGWLESIRPTLTDYKGGALFISTPRGKNYFYSLFLNGGQPDWESFKFTTYDNPFIDKSEIDDAKRQLPIAAFEQEYLANPMENAANPFGSTFIRQCIFPMSTDPVAVYGVDLAKSHDFTVVTGLDKNGSVCFFERFQRDWRQTKQFIINLPKAPILIDSTGVGDAIFEDIQATGINVTGFKFSSTSKQQLIEGLVAAIQQRKISFPAGPIVDELELFEYQFSANGVKYSAPSGFHDDSVVSLALAWKHLSSNVGSGRYLFA